MHFLITNLQDLCGVGPPVPTLQAGTPRLREGRLCRITGRTEQSLVSSPAVWDPQRLFVAVNSCHMICEFPVTTVTHCHMQGGRGLKH